MKILGMIVALNAIIMGADGYSVYQKHCSQCHVEIMEKKEVLRVLHILKAPPMVEVSHRLRENVIISDDDEDVKRRVTTAFIKDYIENPSVQYSMCHPMAIEKFGIMPSLKGKLNEDEKQAVAEWIIDRYKNTKF
jgi:hypothetical protein